MPIELGRDITPLLNGDSLWGDTVTRGLVERRSEGRVVRVFEDAPLSMYTSLAATALRTPDAIALVDDALDQWTFAELLGLVHGFADRLATEGISQGDRVGLLLETSLEFCVALYAANREGVVVVPIPTKYKAAEVRNLLERSDVVVVVAEAGLAHLVPDAIRIVEPADITHAATAAEGLSSGRNADPDRDAILMYTSGTTSGCKGVLLTNRNVGHAIVAYQRILDVTAEDSTIIPVPIYHITGMVALLGLFVHCGGKVFLHRRFDTVRVLTTTRDEGVTFLHASPTVFARLLEHAAEFPALPTLRVMACGAAHMPVSRLQALHRWLPGMEFRTVYGLTETASPGLIFPGDAGSSPFCGSSGRPIPGMDLALLDDSGEPVAVGQTGEIWLRGTNLLRRYDQPMMASLRSDGWLSTGDVGHANAEGYVYITDRTKDMINRGGEKVWCIDLEEALRQLPGIADAAVVGVPDIIYGEVPVALIVPTAGSKVDADAVRNGLRAVVAGYMVPAAVRIAGALPLTANLKVDKRAVRKLFAESAGHLTGE